MPDLSELAAIVGEGQLLTGDAIGDDYTHDEALTATPQRPMAVVRPADTDQVAAVLAWATQHRVPVTARGSGTGLSGACIPRPDGLLVSFERMAAILEIDTANHVAIVQPGVTLHELDEALKPHGLVYPVFPGESSASLGGNVATNAGGMRAVRYGVTRHQVLGLTAVLATGEVMRTGGRFVKATSGYDLTQLIIGSEGTLALATEATLRLHPRLTHGSTILIPFTTVDDVAASIPVIVGSGLMPTILEYIDFMTMAAMTRSANLELGVPEEVREKTLAYLVVVLENRNDERVEEDTGELAELVSGLGALDVYVLPRARAPRSSTRARRRSGTPRPAAPNDLIDLVVPRASIPTYLGRVQADRAGHGIADRRLRPRRRRQRALLRVPGRPGRAHPGHGGRPRGGGRARRRGVGRARHRHREEEVPRRRGGPRQARPHAPHQGRVRPGRDPEPRHHLRLTAGNPP